MNTTVVMSHKRLSSESQGFEKLTRHMPGFME